MDHLRSRLVYFYHVSGINTVTTILEYALIYVFHLTILCIKELKEHSRTYILCCTYNCLYEEHLHYLQTTYCS